MKNFGVEIFFQKNFNVIYKNSLILIFDFYILNFLDKGFQLLRIQRIGKRFLQINLAGLHQIGQ